MDGEAGDIGYNPEVGGGSSITVVNQGTIDAYVSSSNIAIYNTNWSSSGILSVANGGTISLQGTCDNTGATLTLDGSDGSFLFSGSIIGGTVAETNGAALVPQAGTLDGVTVDGAVTVTTDSYLYVKDGLTLNATLTLGDSNGYYGLVDFEGTQTLDGTGTVVFSGPSSGNSLGLSSGTLTIGSGITVEGQSGYVGYSPSFRGSPALINQGTIEADVSGGTISLESTWSSSGILSVANGGTISLVGTSTNTGNTLTLNGSAGYFPFSASISGGTVDETNGATLLAEGGTLDGVTVNGAVTVDDGEYLNVTDGLTLNGTMTVGDGTGWGYVDFEGTQTLGGSGTVTFGSASDYNSLIVGTNNTTLTIGANITVDGETGYIGTNPDLGGGSSITVVNQGIIDADISSSNISIYNTIWSSSGILTVANVGTISLQGTCDNTGGTLTLDGSDGSFLFFGSIVGGTVVETNGATLVPQAGTLDGVTVDCAVTVTTDSYLYVKDGLTLNATLTLGDSNGYYGLVDFEGTQTLDGTGTVVFSGPSSGNSLGLSSGTLTIGSGITVEGQSGYVGYSPSFRGSPALINQGTIDSDVSGGTISLESPWSSSGILSVANGGTISLQGTSTNTGNTLTLNGSDGSFPFSGSIVGGTVDETNGATLLAQGGTLDGVTVDGAVTVDDEGEGLNVTDGLTLNGTLTVGDGTGWGYVDFEGTQTLGGSGTVTFGSTSNYNSLIVGNNNTTLTIGANITVDGEAGDIGYNPEVGGGSSITVVNQGTIDAYVSSSNIAIYNTNWSSSGILSVANGGTISLQGTCDNTGGTLTLDGSDGSFLFFGSIVGGTGCGNQRAALVPQGGTLDGVTVDGAVTVTTDSYLYVKDGLTLNATLTLGDSNDYYGLVDFEGHANAGRHRHGGVQRTEFGQFAGIVERNADHWLGDHGGGPERVCGVQPILPRFPQR